MDNVGATETDYAAITKEWIEMDGKQFYSISYKTKASAPKANIVAIHGFGENISRYAHVFKYFAEAGYNVHGFDQRGFGRTGRKNGPLGHSGNLAQIHLDITQYANRVKENGVPSILFGHSMGGLRVLNYAADPVLASNFVGVIASASAIKPHKSIAPGPLLYYSASALATVLPKMQMASNLDVNKISRDPAVIQDYKADPYNYDIGSLQTLKDMLQSGDAMAKSKAKNIQIPILIAHGDADEITCPETSKLVYEKISSPKKALKLWPGLFHEIHNEPEKNEVLKCYVEWMDEHVTA